MNRPNDVVTCCVCECELVAGSSQALTLNVRVAPQADTDHRFTAERTVCHECAHHVADQIEGLD